LEGLGTRLNHSMRIKNKLIVVTGGSRGIGFAVAEHLAKEGAIVIAASRKAPLLSQLTRAPTGTLTPARLDVTNEESVLNLFNACDRWGRLDVLVNNAGIGIFAPLEQLSLSDWNQVLATNLTGSFLCSREAFRRMKLQRCGRIIHLGSVADYTALPSNGAYSASKYGLRGLNGVLNEEGKAFGVHSTLLSLGAVATEIWQGRSGFNLSDMLQPAQVAETVVHLVGQPPELRIDEIKMLPSKGIL